MPSLGPIVARRREIIPGAGPFLFGILNCTPDSFSDGGLHERTADAVAAGMRMAEEGADVIDVGGESTRPGSRPVPPDEQIRRTREVIAALARRFGPDGPAISIDTRSAQVARAALDAGASIVNDVSALYNDPDMAALIAGTGAGVILMHMKGTPETMQIDPGYEDVVVEVHDHLAGRIDFACGRGIPRERIIIDPGIGFGKTTVHNLKLLSRLDVLREPGAPVMVGASRKRFIAGVLGEGVERRRWGTLASVAACVLAGVECVRVHEVAACRAVADLCAGIRGARG